MAVCLWSIWLMDMSRPGPIDRLGKIKGTDFVHFYVLGSVAYEREWTQLYDIRAQYARTMRIVPEPSATVFVPIESPQTALLMAPLAMLPYNSALFVWVSIIIVT